MITINRKLGVNHLIVSMEWAGMAKSTAIDCMQMMAEEVLPKVECEKGNDLSFFVKGRCHIGAKIFNEKRSSKEF